MSCVVDCCDAVSGLPPSLLGYVYMSTGTYVTRKAKTLENPAVALARSDQGRGTLFVTRAAQLIRSHAGVPREHTDTSSISASTGLSDSGP